MSLPEVAATLRRGRHDPQRSLAQFVAVWCGWRWALPTDQQSSQRVVDRVIELPALAGLPRMSCGGPNGAPRRMPGSSSAGPARWD